MQFIDEADIYVKAGDGGAGAVAFRREKFVPRGGPSGGDGGGGGDIVLESDERLTTLLDFRFKREYRAKNGEPGRGRDQNGHAAPELLLKVPPGTLVRDAETGETLIDLRQPGTRFVLCKGGRGGLGNMNFATPTLQAPRFAQPGTEGEEKRVKLELRLLADVGLVGFPNAGKSTLVARLSRAKPKIADYPFTTLTPHLGVVQYKDGKSFVLTDLPGLIEGAHRGNGLGTRFLRHMQRCRAIVHLVDASSAPIAGRDLLADFDAINRELFLFDRELAQKSQLVAANKVDVPEAREAAEALRATLEKRGLRVHLISGATGEGIDGLLDAMMRAIEGAPMPPAIDVETLERELRESGEGEQEPLRPEDLDDAAEDDGGTDEDDGGVDGRDASAANRDESGGDGDGANGEGLEEDAGASGGEPDGAAAEASAPSARAASAATPGAKRSPRKAEKLESGPQLVDEREEASAEKQKRAPVLTGRRKDGMFKSKAARAEQPLGNKFRPTSEAAAKLLEKAARAQGDGKQVIPKVRELKAPEPKKGKRQSVRQQALEDHEAAKSRPKPAVDEKTRARNLADQQEREAAKKKARSKRKAKRLPPSKAHSAKARRKPNE